MAIFAPSSSQCQRRTSNSRRSRLNEDGLPSHSPSVAAFVCGRSAYSGYEIIEEQ